MLIQAYQKKLPNLFTIKKKDQILATSKVLASCVIKLFGEEGAFSGEKKTHFFKK